MIHLLINSLINSIDRQIHIYGLKPFTIGYNNSLYFSWQGCDASIMIASPNNDAEKDAPDNLSLAGDGFDTVIKAKQAVEQACPGKVSCADILAIAARDVVVLVRLVWLLIQLSVLQTKANHISILHNRTNIYKTLRLEALHSMQNLDAAMALFLRHLWQLVICQIQPLISTSSTPFLPKTILAKMI